MDDFDINDEMRFNDLDAPVPDGLKPFGYWLLVMPIAPRKKTEGGIILPDQVREGEAFMNSVGRIAAIGAGAFKTSKFTDDLGMTEKDFPKVGDLIRYAGVRNREFIFKGATIVDVRDDMIRGFINEEDIQKQHYRFHR